MNNIFPVVNDHKQYDLFPANDDTINRYTSGLDSLAGVTQSSAIISRPTAGAQEGHICDAYTGDTLLHRAVQVQNKMVLDMLLTKKTINVNTLNDSLKTAFHIAAEMGWCYAFDRLLCAANININTFCREEGNTPLHAAVSAGYHDVVVRIVNTRLCNSNHKNISGNTCLHEAARLYNTDIFMFLVKDDDSSINCLNKENLTPIIMAVERRKADIVRFAQEKYGDRILLNKKIYSLLDQALQRKDLELLNVLLLFKHLDVNKISPIWGLVAMPLTPLQYAVTSNFKAGVQALLQHPNIDVDILTDEGLTLQSIAEQKGYNSIVRLLNKNG